MTAVDIEGRDAMCSSTSFHPSCDFSLTTFNNFSSVSYLLFDCLLTAISSIHFASNYPATDFISFLTDGFDPISASFAIGTTTAHL
jgi:hypothetical protein